MRESFWTALAQRAVEVQASARTRAAGKPARSPSPSGRASPATGTGRGPGRFGRRLAAVVSPPRRVVTVQPGSLALVFGEDETPDIRRPGDYLRPHLRAVHNPRFVLVVNTEPVTLDVAVEGLRTVDRKTVLEVVVRVRVQLASKRLEQHLVELVTTVGTDLEQHLLDAVQTEVADAVQGTIRSNRLTDLHRHLPQLLDLNWLPDTLADGHLDRLSVEVLWVGWPEGGSPPERPTSVFPESIRTTATPRPASESPNSEPPNSERPAAEPPASEPPVQSPDGTAVAADQLAGSAPRH